MRIGVFGHYGNGNLGDEAITEATISSARRILSASEIRLYSIVPADSASRHNLDAYPIRRGQVPMRASNSVSLPLTTRPTTTKESVDSESQPVGSALRELLKRSATIILCINLARNSIALPSRIIKECSFLIESFRSLHDLDLMIVAGSNQYLDNFGGVMGFPYTLFKWAILCRIRRIKVVYLSIGAGPIDHFLSRALVRAAIRLGNFHSYRDEDSLRLIEGSGARKNGIVYPDLACNLEFTRSEISFHTETAIVAINPMPVYGDYWFMKDDIKYRNYLTVLADLIIHLDSRGCQIILFPTQTRDMDAIHDLVNIVRKKTSSVAANLRIETTTKTQDVMRVIQSAHVIVPTRFHGAVLGVLAKRLILGICYQAKAVAVLAAAGQQEYAFILDRITAPDLTEAFDQLWRNKKSALEAISRRSSRVRTDIEKQYQHVLTLLE